jgi:D-hydroxyproline dehydrogenase subunit gamma
MPEYLEIEVNGRKLRVAEGTSVAAAVFMAGAPAFRTSVTGEPRAALCGMGICFECRVTINGEPHCRSCQILVRPGMRVETT